MKIRRLGFDLDDIIADTRTALSDYAFEKFGVELDEEQKKFFKWEDMPNINKNLAKEICLKVKDPSFFMELKPIEGAREVLKFLKKKGRSIHIITSRPETSFIFTSKWLKNNDIWYNTLTCCKANWKPRIAAELKIQSFIDDRVDVMQAFLNFRQSTRFLKLGLMDKDWNHNFKHERVVRLFNWEDVLNLLEVRGRRK